MSQAALFEMPLCPTCKGTGKVRRIHLCPRCHGTGRDPFPKHQRHSETSREAAKLIHPATTTIRGKILQLLTDQGPLTDEQIIERSGYGASTARPRRVELVDMDLVASVGYAQTKSNRRANLWDVIR